MAQLILDGISARHRLRYLIADQAGESSPKQIHCDSHGAVWYSELVSELRIVGISLFAKEILQVLKKFGLALGRIFLRQPRHGSVQHSESPLAFISRLGRRKLARTGTTQTFTDRKLFKRNPLSGSQILPFFSLAQHELLHRDKQKAAKPAPLWLKSRNKVLVQNVSDKPFEQL